ncbi:MAG: hypothetical protein HY291_02215 [Planctomycetes bacterium]|nr:hypothetical protein [Planctomycetota bacterium]
MPEQSPAQKPAAFFVQKDGAPYMVDGKPVLVKLSQRKAGGPWWYSFRVGARRVFESSGKHDATKARAAAEAAALGPLPEKPAPVRRLKYAAVSAHKPGEGRRLELARERWFESEEGQTCAAGTASAQYLKNRLERAFQAGWNARAP